MKECSIKVRPINCRDDSILSRALPAELRQHREDFICTDVAVVARKRIWGSVSNSRCSGDAVRPSVAYRSCCLDTLLLLMQFGHPRPGRNAPVDRDFIPPKGIRSKSWRNSHAVTDPSYTTQGHIGAVLPDNIVLSMPTTSGGSWRSAFQQ